MSDNRCLKCGSAYVLVKYCAACWLRSNGEHLHTRCPKCGHETIRECADSEQAHNLKE